MEPGLLALVVITFVAAFVNGALGYGFSSITVPVGLLFFSNRVLNPALVLIEVFINLYVLFINRASIPAVLEAGAADPHRPRARRRARQLSCSPRSIRAG